MSTKPKACSDDEALKNAQAIVERSGNTFHAKVAQFFRGNDWTVMLSPYYVDPATDKAREIDLIAEKLFHVKHRFYEQFIGAIRVRLHIECKYIKHKTVFWFDALDEKQAHGWILRNSLFKPDEGVAQQHHYSAALVNGVAKLFASEDSRELESDPIFKGLNQCLSGLVNSRGMAPLVDSNHVPCLKVVDYPVIVCSNFDVFFRTRVVGAGDIEKMNDNFLIEVNYAYRAANATSQREYFLIDVVEFNRLRRFISGLESEVREMSEIAKRKSGR